MADGHAIIGENALKLSWRFWVPFQSMEDLVTQWHRMLPRAGLDIAIPAHPEPPLIAVLGGAKVSAVVPFLGRAQAILLGGAISYTFLKAQGFTIGNSHCGDDKLSLALALLQEAEAKGTKLLLPVDHVVALEPSPDAACGITDDPSIPEGKMGLDIGPETVALYLEELQRARTILWQGPIGRFDLEPFAAGTLTMAEALAAAADRGAFVLLSGDDTIAAAAKAGVASRLNPASPEP